MTPITKGEWHAIGAITAVGAIARIALLRQPMRFDEAVSWAYYVGRPWRTIVTTYSYPNNHVLYSLLAKFAASSFKYQPWALRLPALVAGIAIIPFLWMVGRRFADKRSALLAAALGAGSMELTLFSTNARGYSLVVLAFLALLLCAHEAMRTSSAWAFVAIAIIGGLGLYTIPVMLYPLGVAGVWMLINVARDRSRRTLVALVVAAMLGALLLAGVLYLPIILTDGLSAITHNKFVTASPWSQFLLELPMMITDTAATWASPLPSAVMLALGVIGAWPTAQRVRPSLLLAAMLWCGALLIATHRVPFVRVWLFLLPLFYLAVARGVIRCLRNLEVPPLAFALPACAVVAVMLSTHVVERADETGLFTGAPDVARAIAPHLSAGDRVFAPIPTNGPLLYYFAQQGLDTASLTLPYRDTRRIFLILDPKAGQDVAWAFANRMMDTVIFTPSKSLLRRPDAEVWISERRALSTP